ncbi:MAG: efflux RND transporter permease subunit, partial [Bryobacteraceae bacterium]
LTRVLRHPSVTLAVLLGTIALNVFLYVRVPKGFFPEQDNGRMMGSIQADQDTSFQSMQKILTRMIKIVAADPAIASVSGSTGGSGGGSGGGVTNAARLYIMLKPMEQRKLSADLVAQRLRPKLLRVPGATCFLAPSQDLRVGGHSTSATYQFVMQGDNLEDLIDYSPRMLQALKKLPIITDANSDQLNHGLQTYVEYDRATAARFGISPQLIDNTLYDAFGQRQASTMYTGLNQYHVVMEAAPQYWQNPDFLSEIYVRSPSGQQVPLSAFAHYAPATAPLQVNHMGLFPAVTISFNVSHGVALGDAVDAIGDVAREVGLPSTIHTTFAGTAQVYQQSLKTEPLLIAAALAAVYIVLGMLYESYIHPITILSTLPSAGVGALLALMLCRIELSIIAIIGIILLIGLVKKNAILMIDFALQAERTEHLSSRDAIYEACLLRFRPILMTTMSAALGALPLALGTGIGAELRRPLGITIIGGLVVSQLLTLYTTPVVYLFLDRLQVRWERTHPARAGEGDIVGSEA